MSQLILLIASLLMISAISNPEYVWGQDHPTSPIPGPGELSFSADPISGTPSDPLCRLSPEITGVHKQDSSAWCWAASTHLVVKYFEPDTNLKQCELAYRTLELRGAVEQYEQAHPGVGPA